MRFGKAHGDTSTPPEAEEGPHYTTRSEFDAKPPSLGARIRRHWFLKGYSERPRYMQQIYNKTPRRVFVNMDVPDDMRDPEGEPLTHYPPNKIRTTKYTPVTFLPKNILFQFTNVANVYFLILIILGAFSIFGVDSPGLAAVPLIVIVCITAAKDAFEDYRRAVSDSELNNSPVHLLLGLPNPNTDEYKETRWERFSNRVSRATARFWNKCQKLFIRIFFSEKAKQKHADKEQKQEDLALQTMATVDSEVTPRPSGVFRRSRDFPRHSRDKRHSQLSPLRTLSPSNRASSDRRRSGDPRPSMMSSRSRIHPTKVVPHSIVSPELVEANGDHSNVTKFKNRKWKDITVGSFVRIRNDEEVPADIIVISTSDIDGKCLVETKNLDGETNLKTKTCLPCGGSKVIKHSTDFGNVRFWVELDAPNPNLYNFRGTIHYENWDHGTLVNPDQRDPITNDNVLLRGSALRNTDWVIGLVVYTGSETKIMLNSGITPSKKSRIQQELNLSVVINFLLLFVLCFVSGLVNGLYYNNKRGSRHWYEGEPYSPTSAGNGVVAFFVALIMYQSLVPISLYISVEIIKTCQAYFIHVDNKMYYQPLDFACVPKSWSISDDLGQIEYIFSDKTGTLTQNVMEFKKCTIAGKSYGLAYTEAKQGMDRRAGVDIVTEADRWRRLIAKDKEVMEERLQDLGPNPQYDEATATFVSSEYVDDVLAQGPQCSNNEHFMLALALCNTIIATRDDDGHLHYEAESPDEAALVAAARDVGIVFTQRRRDRVILTIYGNTVEYTVLDIIPFTSSRKRMSVIVKTPDNRILLICKGADNVIYERLSGGQANPEKLLQKTALHLEEYATEGLRTLCIAQREIDPKFFADWTRRNREANASIEDNRDILIEQIADEVEQNFILLGGTAIEDRLQQGVPDSIAILGNAGIKMWVLTGDRVETAINIGFSCNLLENDMKLLVVRPTESQSLYDIETLIDQYLVENFGIQANSDDEITRLIKEAKKDHSIPSNQFGLVIDGAALTLIFAKGDGKKPDPHAVAVQRKFLLLGKQCKSVLCCRVSPAQKAAVVQTVKDTLEVMTLAIGDGANDVAMIQAANVGVGIAGEEGRQAVMSSDYAIGQFRFLTRLLLVHGRWSYKRLAEMVPCFFYKNVVFTMTLFWYQIYTDFDGSYLYEYTYLMFYNLAFTSLPVIFLAIFDQDVSDTVSLLVPELFRSGILQKDWSQYKFIWYMIDGVYQSVISFYWPYLIFYKAFTNMDGFFMGHRFWMGVVCALITVTVCNVYVLLQQKRWDWLSVLINAISILIVFFWSGVWSCRVVIGEFYGAASNVLGNLSCWCAYFISIVCCLLPRFTWDFLRANFDPSDVEIVREQMKQGKFDDYPTGYDPTDLEDIERRNLITNIYENNPHLLDDLEKEIEQKYPPREHHHKVTRAMSTLKRKTTSNLKRHKDPSQGSLKKNLNTQFHHPLSIDELRTQMIREGELTPNASVSRVSTTHDIPGFPQAESLMKYHSGTSQRDIV
ncbi:hypothetical protein DIURU_002597 [Diutina rugosa]|uniref:Phospholipid-transporting ATPase n=1 Tax=Diutina rugosa TaxID=5481 RepID=A0A642URD0_DIURU|nr:uncharacterized protein DIURU_002597 [Diutina rugosa]KAA8902996.1 hypothetical protein DIURU_002597 [Diutina rugosa]